MEARSQGRPSRLRLWRPRTLNLCRLAGPGRWGDLADAGAAADASVNILHERSPVFVQLSDGSIRNGYAYKILNMARRERAFTVSLEGVPGARLDVIGGDTGVTSTTLAAPRDQRRHLSHLRHRPGRVVHRPPDEAGLRGDRGGRQGHSHRECAGRAGGIEVTGPGRRSRTATAAAGGLATHRYFGVVVVVVVACRHPCRSRKKARFCPASFEQLGAARAGIVLKQLPDDGCGMLFAVMGGA